MKPHRCLWQIKHWWMCHAICGGKQQLVARREAKAARLCDCSLEGAVIFALNDSDYGHYDKCVFPTVNCQGVTPPAPRFIFPAIGRMCRRGVYISQPRETLALLPALSPSPSNNGPRAVTAWLFETGIPPACAHQEADCWLPTNRSLSPRGGVRIRIAECH